jgi:hypothetical protein
VLLIKLSYITVDSQHHEPATSMLQHHAPQQRPECLRTVRSGRSNLTLRKYLQSRIPRHCFNIPLNKVIKVILQHPSSLISKSSDKPDPTRRQSVDTARQRRRRRRLQASGLRHPVPACTEARKREKTCQKQYHRSQKHWGSCEVDCRFELRENTADGQIWLPRPDCPEAF